MTQERTEWRAEPDAHQARLFRVAEYRPGTHKLIRVIIGGLLERDARLIAAAPAKGRLCEEMADALENAANALESTAHYVQERTPHKAVAEAVFSDAEIARAAAKAGRTPQ